MRNAWWVCAPPGLKKAPTSTLLKGQLEGCRRARHTVAGIDISTASEDNQMRCLYHLHTLLCVAPTPERRLAYWSNAWTKPTPKGTKSAEAVMEWCAGGDASTGELSPIDRWTRALDLAERWVAGLQSPRCEPDPGAGAGAGAGARAGTGGCKKTKGGSPGDKLEPSVKAHILAEALKISPTEAEALLRDNNNDIDQAAAYYLSVSAARAEAQRSLAELLSVSTDEAGRLLRENNWDKDAAIQACFDRARGSSTSTGPTPARSGTSPHEKNTATGCSGGGRTAGNGSGNPIPPRRRRSTRVHKALTCCAVDAQGHLCAEQEPCPVRAVEYTIERDNTFRILRDDIDLSELEDHLGSDQRIVLYMHGWLSTPAQAAISARRMQQEWKRGSLNVLVLPVLWPAGTIDRLAQRSLASWHSSVEARCTASAELLAPAVEELAESVQINVVAHAMGNQLLLETAPLLPRNTYTRAVLVAADVDANIFAKPAGEALMEAATLVRVCFHQSDEVLLLSEQVHGKRLGQQALAAGRVTARLADVRCSHTTGHPLHHFYQTSTAVLDAVGLALSANIADLRTPSRGSLPFGKKATVYLPEAQAKVDELASLIQSHTQRVATSTHIGTLGPFGQGTVHPLVGNVGCFPLTTWQSSRQDDTYQSGASFGGLQSIRAYVGGWSDVVDNPSATVSVDSRHRYAHHYVRFSGSGCARRGCNIVGGFPMV